MKNKLIHLSKSNRQKLPFASDKIATKIFENEGINKEGWSFVNIYHFSEVRDFYLKLKEVTIVGKTFKEYEIICQNLPYSSKPWNDRRIEEFVNALKNFNVLDKQGNIINPLEFTSLVGSPLNTGDLESFKNIFYTYFRFKEVTGWFINPIVSGLNNTLSDDLIRDKTKVIFATSMFTRFTDTIFYELDDNTSLYTIQSDEADKSESRMQRFWDVFCKWGTTLNLLQKFNLDYFGIRTNEGKSISCCYFIHKNPGQIVLKEYIKNNFRTKYIHLPELVLKLCIDFRYSVENAKSLILSEYEKDRFSYSLDRTSEIFIRTSKIKIDSVKANEIIFHPIYKDYYISHLTVLQ